MMLQWGSTIKVSIELPVATRHRHDMTEKLLKATLNPTKQQQQQFAQIYLSEILGSLRYVKLSDVCKRK